MKLILILSYLLVTPEKLCTLSILPAKTFIMRWELASSNEKNEVYHLFKDDKAILTLVIDSFSRTARVECNNEKRVFQIRKEGFLRNKMVIRNEYGIRIGELGQEN